MFPGFNYLNLGTPISTVVDPPHNCSLWDEIGYDLVGLQAPQTANTCAPLPTPRRRGRRSSMVAVADGAGERTG